MQNFVKPGKTVTFTPPVGGVVAGTGYLIIDTFVVATNTISSAQAAAGVLAEGMVEGVFDLPKAAGAWAEGRAVYWDVAEAVAKLDDESGANVLIGGVVYPAAANSDTTGRVRLNGITLPRIDLGVS